MSQSENRSGQAATLGMCSTTHPPPRTNGDLARLLDVSERYLKLVLRSGLRYSVFRITKKSGGTREIAAPSDPIKQLQHRLLHYLETVYTGRSSAHGFIKQRSIRTNAEPHSRTRYVFNLDLENFFPSIHFGRVRGLLMGKPYFWGKKAATSAANLCCRDTVLPQGAPTSPIIANMVCAKLDSELKTLAKKFHATYTRYADDITFSTMSQSFPKVLAVHAGELTRQVEVGDELRKIIESNGFSVNTKKTRLARHERQEVTGLTTNRFPNVQRRFVRQIRAMIHAWRRHGLDKAQSEYWTKFDHRNRQGKRPSFARVVRGKIEFVGSVRGKTDPIYWRLLRQYADLYVRDVDRNYQLREPDGFVEYDFRELKKAIWVLFDKTTLQQSTAFCLKNVGLVTCDHAIGDPGSLVVFQSRDPLMTEYPVRLLSRDQKLDLAILEAPFQVPKWLLAGDDDAIKQRDLVRLLGFPQHHNGADVSISEGYVVHEYKFENVRRFHISASIIHGNSGGPVLNSENRVIGVAIKGGQDELNGVVPISYAFRLSLSTAPTPSDQA